MLLPTIDDLNKIANLMHGMDYVPLPANLKFPVVEIAQRGVLAYIIDQAPTNLAVSFAEALVEHGPKWKQLIEGLDEIDKSLGPVMDWFKHSKLWDGPA